MGINSENCFVFVILFCLIFFRGIFIFFAAGCVLVKLDSSSDVSREVSSFFSRLNIQPPELLKVKFLMNIDSF